MEILVNGEPLEIEEGQTLMALVEKLSLAEKRIAVELNREIVPHGQYQNHLLNTGDRIEIVHAIGGGSQ